MNRRRAGVLAGLAAASGLTLAAVSPGCPEDPRDKPDCPAITVEVNSPQLPYWPGASEPTTFDADDEQFNTDNGYVKARRPSISTEPPPSPVVCWIGGTFGSQSLDPQSTPWATWHDLGTDLYISRPDVTVTGTRHINSGDAIGANGQNFHLHEIEVPDADKPAHDDCVSDDTGRSGRITDSLFAACSSAFLSARSPNMDGTGQTVEIADTLVRMVGFDQGYRADDYNGPYGPRAHGGFWKWDNTRVVEPDGDCLTPDGIAPALYVHDSVFRADQPGAPYGNPLEDTLAIPRTQRDACGQPTVATRCENVTLIGDGFTSRALASWRAVCSDLTVLTGSEGVTEWDRRVAAWREEHP